MCEEKHENMDGDKKLIFVALNTVNSKIINYNNKQNYILIKQID